MVNKFSMDYQYNRCVSRGICSINPTTASLLEIILLYLKYTVFYELKLEEYGIKKQSIRNLVLNVIAILSSNYEISEKNFYNISSAFISELPKIIDEYKNLCHEKEINPIEIDLGILLNPDTSLSEYIRFGEKEFYKRVKEIKNKKRKLYKILLVLIKSMCINTLTLESFGIEADNEILTILRTINSLYSSTLKTNELKKIITDIAKQDCFVMKKIREEQEKIYGEQTQQEVSFSTQKGKALLVVGSNLKELEQILDKLNGTNIDVYTHDNMITAHTFPKFREYKNLKGQFGKGMENCLLDFSTFPGPIILTRYSLYNIENLYRGRLFTTDFAYSKGVIPIKNNDFSEVITSAEESKGFKNGKVVDNELIGISYSESINLIKQKSADKNIKNLIIISSQGYSSEEESYFNSFIKHIPKNTLIIALSGCEEQENLICLNMRADTYGILKISENIINIIDKKITFIFPHCDRHVLSIMMYLKSLKNSNFYIGVWNQTILTPDILNCLKIEFGIDELTTPKNDLSKMTKNT